MRHWITAAALAGIVMSSAACAQPAPQQNPSPTKVDRRAVRLGDGNGDGVVTRAEFLAQAAKRFDMMDANKDGQLTPEERKAARDTMRAERPGGPGGMGPDGMGPGGPGGDKAGGPGMPPPPGGAGPRGLGGGGGGGMLARLDTNGDGKVTRAEYAAPFDLLDANKDGFIDATERAAIPQGGPGGGGAGGGGRMARLDRDGDGKLSRAEFEAPFARIDTNNDGVVDASERDAIRARLGAGGGRRFGGQGPRASEAELQPQ